MCKQKDAQVCVNVSIKYVKYCLYILYRKELSVSVYYNNMVSWIVGSFHFKIFP